MNTQSKSDKIQKIYQDIKSIKIQGATNVALATLNGILTYVQENYKGEAACPFEEITKVGKMLSEARPNEPLARNAVTFLQYNLRSRDIYYGDVLAMVEQFKLLIANGKGKMIFSAKDPLLKAKNLFTHCHSSSVISIIKNLYKIDNKIKVIATETRPLFQGRITAEELLKENIDVTLIVDSASSAFIINDEFLPVDVILVGCDELLPSGDFMNKIGTYAISLAASESKHPVYVVTPLLKMNIHGKSSDQIEARSSEEIWPDAPKGLKIINPAFDLVPNKYVAGYITEAGVLKPNELYNKVLELYPWLQNKI